MLITRFSAPISINVFQTLPATSDGQSPDIVVADGYPAWGNVEPTPSIVNYASIATSSYGRSGVFFNWAPEVPEDASDIQVSMCGYTRRTQGTYPLYFSHGQFLTGVEFSYSFHPTADWALYQSPMVAKTREYINTAQKTGFWIEAPYTTIQVATFWLKVTYTAPDTAPTAIPRISIL